MYVTISITDPFKGMRTWKSSMSNKKRVEDDHLFFRPIDYPKTKAQYGW